MLCALRYAIGPPPLHPLPPGEGKVFVRQTFMRFFIGQYLKHTMVAGRWEICKQARIFNELPARDRGDGCASGRPRVLDPRRTFKCVADPIPAVAR